MTKNYTWHVDSGHAWLEVKLSELKQTIDTKSISKYSYIDGGVVYLEEDCDAPKFIKSLGGCDLECSEKFYNGSCFIRNLNRFTDEPNKLATFQKSPDGISFSDLPTEYQQDERKSYCDGDFGRIDALPNGRFRVYDSWKDSWHPFDRWENAMSFFKMLCRINAAKF